MFVIVVGGILGLGLLLLLLLGLMYVGGSTSMLCIHDTERGCELCRIIIIIILFLSLFIVGMGSFLRHQPSFTRVISLLLHFPVEGDVGLAELDRRHQP